MPRYVKFPVPDGPPILVEVNEPAPDAPEPTAKGLGSLVQTSVTTAQTTFEDALQHAVGTIANAFVQVVHGLPHPPDEIETTFSLTVTGDLGLFVVAKVGGEANYTIRLAWTRGAGAASAGGAESGGAQT
jgi:hypothetical protein